MTFTEAKIKCFTEEQENSNTKKKTSNDLKLKELLTCGDRKRKNQEIPAAELQDFAIRNQKSGEFEQKQISKRRIVLSVTVMKTYKQFYIDVIQLLKASVREILPFRYAICSIVI